VIDYQKIITNYAPAMKKLIPISALLVCIIVSLSLASKSDSSEESPPSNLKENLREDVEEESEIAFNTMMDVLTHQRCMNCHPSDNVPKQGEDSHPHRFGITRVNSMNATNCNTCHQASNNDYSGVPGASEWSLAPQKMYWEGLNR
jgi:hypothetical protein